MANDEPIRRVLHFSGHVQGVGFRMESYTVASSLPLTGFVRNLDDGRVELVAEGQPAALDECERRLTASMGSYIESIERTDGVCTGDFDRFTIQF